MKYYAKPLNRLINELARLPGIGERTAQRLALHILSMNDAEAFALSDARLLVLSMNEEKKSLEDTYLAIMKDSDEKYEEELRLAEEEDEDDDEDEEEDEKDEEEDEEDDEDEDDSEADDESDEEKEEE